MDDFGSGHDPTVHEIVAWDSLSPSISAPPLLTLSCTHARSLKINLKKKVQCEEANPDVEATASNPEDLAKIKKVVTLKSMFSM